MTIRRKSRSTVNPLPDNALPEAELEVLACVHQQGEAEAATIRERLTPFRPMTHASVVTLLRRLEDKSLVTKRKGERGKAFIYSAVQEPGATYRQVVGRLLERVFGGSKLTLVSSLFETKAPTEDELTQLRELVEQLYRKNRQRETK
jgi:BlaI family transcriptional regulator, penicillinase repressor